MGLTDTEPRWNALVRVGVFLYVIFLGSIVTGVIQGVYAIWVFFDILISFVLGYELPSSKLARRNYEWYVNQYWVVFFNDGSPSWNFGLW